MSFERMCEAVSHLLPRVYEHPFNKGLSDGSLSKNIFRLYLEQDALYLKDFAKALQITSKRFVNESHASQFQIFFEETLSAERELHSDYLGAFESAEFFSQKKKIDKIPVISAYTEHLLHAASTLSVEESVASLTPCFWLYNELGKVIASANTMKDSNPYQRWIASYSCKQFTSSAQSMIQISEELGAAVSCPLMKEKMTAAFIKSTEYEILFWDSVTQAQDAVPVLSFDH